VAVRAFAAGEVALGLWSLSSPGRASAAALTVLYAGFAGFLAFLILGRVEVSSCGCAGERDLPPSWVHVGLNLAAAGAGLAVALKDPTVPGVGRSLHGLPLGGAGLVIGVGTLTWLGLLCVAYLPGALAAYRGRT
jgi:hypothetical protein